MSLPGFAVATVLCVEAEPIEVSFGSRTRGAGFLLPLHERSRVDRLWSAYSGSVAAAELTNNIDNPGLLRIDMAQGIVRAFTVYGDGSACDDVWISVFDVPLWGAKCRVTNTGVTERVTYGDLRPILASNVIEKIARGAMTLGFTDLLGRALESFGRLVALGWPQAVSYAPASSRLKVDVSVADAKAIAHVIGALCGPADGSRIRRIARRLGGALAYVSLSIDRSGQLDWRVYSRPLLGLDPEQILYLQGHDA